MAQKKRWSDLSPRTKAAIAVAGTAEVVATMVALQDLRRRPRGQVRGPKLLWVLSFVVQPFGPLLYLSVGRHRASV
jgi:Phospholipase_D-nuclease N-terminal